MKKTRKHKGHILNSLFFQLAAVNILINLIQPCNQLIDTILTGKALGAQALQVYALFLPVNSFLLAVSCMLSKGAQITSSHLIGGGRFEESDKAVNTSFYMGTAISVCFTLICLCFPGKLAAMLGSGPLTEEVSVYLRAYAIGIPAAILLDTLMCLLQLEGKKKTVVVGSICGFAVNAAGDLLNIFIFKKGLLGMALATSASYILTFLVLATVFLKQSRLFSLKAVPVKADCVLEILKNGLPSLAYYGSLVVRTAFMNMLIIRYLDREALVAMLVFTNFGTVTDVLIGGHSDAVLVLGGVLYGEKDKEGARSLLRTALISGAVMMLIVSVLTVGFSVPLARLFLNKEDLAYAPAASTALKIAALYLVQDIISCVEKKYIQAIGNRLYTAVTNVVYNVLCVCSFAWILTQLMGGTGLFLSFACCYLVAAIVNSFYIVVFSGRRFEDAAVSVKVFTIYGLDECIRASEEIYSYYRAMGVDSRKCNLISLFTEEIGKNIITYGFGKRNNESIVMKAMKSGDKITLNIKDNCMLFDPTRYYEILKKKDTSTADGIGIRMMMELSKKVVYTTSFNLNNLLIEV